MEGCFFSAFVPHGISHRLEIRNLKPHVVSSIAGMHAFGKTLGNLRTNEKASIVNVIKSKLGPATEAQISGVLDAAQKLADEFAGTDAFKKAGEFDMALQALAAAVV